MFAKLIAKYALVALNVGLIASLALIAVHTEPPAASAESPFAVAER